MNCKWIEILLAAIIIVFSFWEQSYSMWIIVIAAILLLAHAFMCNSCHRGSHGMMDMMSDKKKRKR